LAAHLGLPVVVAEYRFEGDEPGVRVVENVAWIFPNLPLPFVWDPVERSRDWLLERVEAICREVRDSILAQAAVYEQQMEAAGYRKPGSWLRRPERWALRGERLYRRAVLGWTYDRIADAEAEAQASDPAARCPDADAIRKTTTADARLLRISMD
jgi:hypothetical protein